MQSPPPEDVSPPGMSDQVPHGQESVDPLMERLLSERALRHRAPEGLAERIARATAPAIVPPTYAVHSGAPHRTHVSGHRADVAAARLRRFALAASLALLAGVAFLAVVSNRAPRDTSAGVAELAGAPDPAAGLTDSEPVLVSLLAGSDVDPAGADEHPAEAILRMRDASFSELQGEVLLVVSAGVGIR